MKITNTFLALLSKPSVVVLPLLPVMNLIRIPTIYNDRYLYLPILSFPVLFYLILGTLIAKKKLLKSAAILIFPVLVLSCGLLSYQRNKIWHDSLTLWLDTAKKSPASCKAYYNLGNAYAGKEMFEEAIKSYKKAISLGPAIEPDRTDIENRLARLLESDSSNTVVEE